MLVFAIRFPRAAFRLPAGESVVGKLALLVVALAAVQGSGPDKARADQLAPAAEEFFEKQVRPLLAKRCFECHGREEQEGGLRLDRQAHLLLGGDSGPAVVPEDPDGSRLIQAIRYGDVRFQMPPDGKLSDTEIAVLVRWVKLGAPWPDDQPPAGANTPSTAPPSERIDQFRAEHWAFQPITRPPLPKRSDRRRATSPIDVFVQARLSEAGLQSNPPADRRTLLRRAYFTLLGLPPTYQQVKQFEQDQSPDALARVVDRLLSSPHYGERWARHWLDVARYSDTKGYMGVGTETRYPYAYTYRDWLIDALNDDLPYNRFIMQQLAADRLGLPPESPKLAAMGFLNVGRRFNGKIHDVIDDRIDVVSRGFLGLSVGCARCHDHKYDPIPTADYYSLYGVFASGYEPDQLPRIGGSPDSPQRQAFERELAKRQQAVDQWIEDLRKKVQDELRSRVADYLVYHSRTLPKYDNGQVQQRGKRGYLRRGAIARWKRYLQKSQSGAHPVWGLWHRFADLPADDFAAQAKRLMESIDRVAQQSGPLNARLVEEFRSRPPTSLQDASQRIGTLLEQVHADWKQLRKADPQRPGFDDPAREQLRGALLEPDSPLVLDAEQTLSHFTQGERGEYRKLSKKVQALEFSHPGAPPRAMVLLNKGEPVEPVIFRRGQPANRGDRVPRRFLQILAHVDGGEPFAQGSGRLEMARAIADPDNPLTARVIVNRVWQHHFGAGLVRTPSDFGVRGERPTHPQLLDWLAAEFLQRGWSIKHLHRLIMSSELWQQSSTIRADAQQRDPENRLLWRMPRSRLEFEPLRDSLLQVSGRLDRTVGGRSVPIHEQATRRALYAFIDRENVPRLLASFDVPHPDATTAVRAETTVPQQSLYLMNSPLVIEQAELLAAGWNGPPARGITMLYRRILARDPAPEEVELAKRFVQGLSRDRAAATGSDRPPWQFGYGAYDAAAGRTVAFTRLPHFTGRAWQGSSTFPDPKLHYLRLTAAGGHVGVDARHNAIRRWKAPLAGVVRIGGTLKHGENQGDGVQAWIVSSRGGQLGHWIAHHSEAETPVASVEVQQGDTLDFIVNCRSGHGWDSFAWAPSIEWIESSDPKSAPAGATWNAADDFASASEKTPRQAPLSPWAQLAQVLLLSNEFAIVD